MQRTNRVATRVASGNTALTASPRAIALPFSQPHAHDGRSMKLSLASPVVLLPLALSVLASGCANHCVNCEIDVPDKSNFVHTIFVAHRPNSPRYSVYRTKTNGPPVLVLHEVNGLSAPPLDFALELGARHGWTVYAPTLFGRYGAPSSRTAAALGALKTRLSPHWDTKDMHSSGRVLEDVGDMAGWISRLHGGQKVIVMGNCLTGGFPLALLARPDVKAAILCQPSMPYQSPFAKETAEYSASFALSDDTLDATIAAMKRDPGKRLLGFRYVEDALSPKEKFDMLHLRLRREGLAHRFRPVILYPPGAERTRPWADERSTEARYAGLGMPHNTVTSSASLEDRRRMRALLYRQLAALR